jgi:hypothetical protein
MRDIFAGSTRLLLALACLSAVAVGQDNSPDKDAAAAFKLGPTVRRPSNEATFPPPERPKPFWRKPKFLIGVAAGAAAVKLDQHYSDAAFARGDWREGNRFLRGPNGGLLKGRQWLIWGALNSALLPADMSDDARLQWAAFAVRMLSSSLNVKGAIHNARLVKRPRFAISLTLRM